MNSFTKEEFLEVTSEIDSNRKARAILSMTLRPKTAQEILDEVEE